MCALVYCRQLAFSANWSLLTFFSIHVFRPASVNSLRRWNCTVFWLQDRYSLPRIQRARKYRHQCTGSVGSVPCMEYNHAQCFLILHASLEIILLRIVKQRVRKMHAKPGIICLYNLSIWQDKRSAMLIVSVWFITKSLIFTGILSLHPFTKVEIK